MKTIYLATDTTTLPPCVATIGFFDGVHLGHRHLIAEVCDEAQRQGLASAVVTFSEHPRQVVDTAYVPQLLTSLDDKLQLMADTGIDYAVLLPFDRAMAALTARSFMLDVLQRRINVHTLLTGYDTRFGHDRKEGFADYVRYGKEMGMTVMQASAYSVDGQRVSSSLIRSLLTEGRVADAAHFLGRCYSIVGRVESGYREGRRMGFPTANIAPQPTSQLIPMRGAYAARIQIDGGQRWPAMLNVGCCPTFGRHQLTIEAHIIGFSADIYGHSMRAEFVQRLRAERQFEGEEALKAQLAADEQHTLEILEQIIDKKGENNR